MSKVLHCEGVSKSFKEGENKIQVLKDISLSIEKGERTAIVGTSGSGKSTLLHLLGGLDKPCAGNIEINDQCMTSLSENALSKLRNQTLGFVYQFHHLLPEFTVLENVCMPLLIRGEKIKIAKEKAKTILEKMGLGERLKHKVGEISGGERQRTAIARAMVTNPACILADEPTGNLDKKTAQTVFNFLLDLNKEFGTSLLVVTHDLEIANQMDRILHLEDGVLS